MDAKRPKSQNPSSFQNLSQSPLNRTEQNQISYKLELTGFTQKSRKLSVSNVSRIVQNAIEIDLKETKSAKIFK